MIAYDFEVFKCNWLIKAIDPETDKIYTVWDSMEKLNVLYEKYKDDIWVGFNNRHYDQYIFKAILSGMNAYNVSNKMIKENVPGWKLTGTKVFMINYDVMPLNSSLKQLEGFQGHSIHETSVSFDIDRPLTEEEKRETERYCENDVLETLNVLSANINDFKSQLWLVNKFGFPLSYMGKTKAQITAEILECEPKDRNDEWDLSILPCIKLSDKKQWLRVKKKRRKGDEEKGTTKVVEKVFMAPKEWFLTERFRDYRMLFETEVCGIKHTFAWGGIHGGKEQYHYKCDSSHLLLHIDVESYYPRMMIFHNLLTRNAKKPERFREIFEQRMRLKHEGKKKEQAPLKIVINGTYGICKDELNKAYDPRNANLVCVNGQLMLLDLIEHLSVVPSFELVQSNTDGLIIKIDRRDFYLVDDICYEWEERCNMRLGFDYISEIFQKDVNNYAFRFADSGEWERKGAYVKEQNPMDNDMPILNKALIDYMQNGTPVERTIKNCNDLIMFQKISKLTSNYSYVMHNGKRYNNKCFRIFASIRSSDGPVKKIKPDGHSDKVGMTSMKCFIDNGDITNKAVPPYLDKQWYIDEANRRLAKYGVF